MKTIVLGQCDGFKSLGGQSEKHEIVYGHKVVLSPKKNSCHGLLLFYAWDFPSNLYLCTGPISRILKIPGKSIKI